MSGTGMGCGGTDTATELHVFAASSLTDVFTELAAEFEVQHDIPVRLAFAGSQTLRMQIEGGARADVIATADSLHMSALFDQRLVSAPVLMARNPLVVIAPPTGARTITRFADLARVDRIVVGTTGGPIGRYADTLLARISERRSAALADSIRGAIVSREPNVRLVRAKVELGEADAAIVYLSDARSSDRVRAIPIPEDIGVEAGYWMARVEGSANDAGAREWLDFLRSDAAGRAFDRHGMLRP